LYETAAIPGRCLRPAVRGSRARRGRDDLRGEKSPASARGKESREKESRFLAADRVKSKQAGAATPRPSPATQAAFARTKPQNRADRAARRSPATPGAAAMFVVIPREGKGRPAPRRRKARRRTQVDVQVDRAPVAGTSLHTCPHPGRGGRRNPDKPAGCCGMGNGMEGGAGWPGVRFLGA